MKKLFFHHFILICISIGIVIGLSGCQKVTPTVPIAHLDIYVDKKNISIDVPLGKTVRQALDLAQINLGTLDRTEPDMDTIIDKSIQVRVIQVKEEFSVEKEIIPFEQKIVQTESLPENVTLLAQKGANGEKEITYRHLYEDGVEVSKTPINDGVIIKEAVPQIMMVGIQKPFVTYQIPGRIAYILGGNAWIIDENTSNRILVVSSGDLDGRVFSLSPNGEWLLFSRRETSPDLINSLWAAHLVDFEKPIKVINLKITNVVHFADWYPKAGSLRIVFSTVEPRNTAPGWQANNNLVSVEFSASGWIDKWRTMVDTNSGGVYGWWGTDFAVNQENGAIAFARPDGVGLIDDNNEMKVLLPITPFQTGSEWAWVPGITWSPDGNFIYTVDHLADQEHSALEESRNFALTAVSITQSNIIHLIQTSGMFSYPATSPMMQNNEKEFIYQLAFLQALMPDQSETSRYKLAVMDQDGSNLKYIFPDEGQPGLDPQKVIWSPDVMPDSGKYALAVIYQGNLYIIDSSSPENQPIIIRQITGDGLVNKVVWSSK
ncbi:MAG: G5 domain-containing protein [Anaerolineales bacterium]